MNQLTRQARRFISASLLLFFLVSCSAPSTPASANTARPTTQPTHTQTVASTLVAQSRTEVETYTVREGDTITSIAAGFSLDPETVLLANYELLFDSPDFLYPGMQLTILPIDGLYHQVGGTDTITSIANFFAADPQAVIDWPGNEIDANNPVIFPGQWLVIPDGTRGLRRRLMPSLPRFAMAVSFEESGGGSCPQNSFAETEGDGIYGWPVSQHEIAGEPYWSAHPGVDMAAIDGEEVIAADDGVVVFSGWSNFGYGNMVMLDHGNENYTVYAGLAEATALCGFSVSEGDAIGIAGYTGHPAGTYFHFEIRQGGENIDPLLLLPA